MSNKNKYTGLLWFDDDPKRDWRDKVRAAAKRHQERFWLVATTCHVNPADVEATKIDLNHSTYVGKVDDIDVYASTNTLLHHFFIYHIPRPASSTPADTAPSLEQPALF